MHQGWRGAEGRHWICGVEYKVKAVCKLAGMKSARGPVLARGQPPPPVDKLGCFPGAFLCVGQPTPPIAKPKRAVRRSSQLRPSFAKVRIHPKIWSQTAKIKFAHCVTPGPLGLY